MSVNLSVPTLDEKIWRETEPHTPHPRKRLEAVAKFNEAGIPSGVLVAPLMPGINDSPELVEEIVSIAEEAGATFVNGIALHLRPGVKEVFMSWLSAARPDLVPALRQPLRGPRIRAECGAEADRLPGPRAEPLPGPALQPPCPAGGATPPTRRSGCGARTDPNQAVLAADGVSWLASLGSG